MFSEIFWVFLLLETFIIGVLHAEGCEEHLQKKFCNSEFVFKAFLPKKRNFKGPYRLRPKVIFKGDVSKINLVGDGFIALNSHSILDSLSERQLLIFGQSKNGHIQAEMCEGIVPKRWMTSFQMKALRKFYFTGCDCIDQIEKYTRPMFCKWQHSYKKKYEGNCTWVGSAALDTCERRSLEVTSEPAFITTKIKKINAFKMPKLKQRVIN